MTFSRQKGAGLIIDEVTKLGVNLSYISGDFSVLKVSAYLEGKKINEFIVSLKPPNPRDVKIVKTLVSWKDVDRTTTILADRISISIDRANEKVIEGIITAVSEKYHDKEVIIELD